MGYVIIWLVCFMFAVAYDIFKVKKNEKIAFSIIIFVLSILPALRYRVGYDTPMYMQFYVDVPKIQDLTFHYFTQSRYESGWIGLNSLFKTIYNNYFVLQIAIAIFVNSVILNFIRRNFKSYYTFSFIYYLTTFYAYYNFEVMREAIAISFFLIAYKSYLKDSYAKYYFYVFISFLFHQGAMILFLLPLVKKLKIPEKKMTYFIYIALLSTLIFLPVKEILIACINYFPAKFKGKIIHYLYYSDILNSNMDLIPKIKNLVIVILWMLILYFKNKNDLLNKKYNDLQINKLILTYFILKFISINFKMMERFLNYFYIFYLSLTMYIFKVLYKKMNRLPYLGIFMAYAFMISLKLLAHYCEYNPRFQERSVIKYYPYYTFLSEKSFYKRERIATQNSRSERYFLTYHKIR